MRKTSKNEKKQKELKKSQKLQRQTGNRAAKRLLPYFEPMF